MGKHCMLHEKFLLDRYHEAKHCGTVEGATFTTERVSPACGDKIVFSGIVRDRQLVDLRFTGEGSILSQVFADLLCDWAISKTVEEINALAKEDAIAMLQADLGPTRQMTIIFVLDVLREGLNTGTDGGAGS
ncbi:MAG: iron-sulfur cluster assembly scaffold protein [Candidatus Dependentiae bacterium]|nr:iron-sulfur cluster assembly scaffold protein [Candidatus Dependentiae bacterium]